MHLDPTPRPDEIVARIIVVLAARWTVPRLCLVAVAHNEQSDAEDHGFPLRPDRQFELEQ